MNLSEYQKAALTTAAPEAFQYAYLANGLMGELGELTGRIAKGIWKKDVGTAAYLTDLALEYGDICWMAAILLYKQGVHGRDAWGHPFGRHVPYPQHEGLTQITLEITGMYCEYLQSRAAFYIDARQLWDLLEDHCHEVTGYPFASVLQMNINKLASRAARGTLIGNGDHR